MNILLCATENMYPQLQRMISMLNRTQTAPLHLYAFVETDIPSSGNLTCVNVAKYSRFIQNTLNKDNQWTQMCFSRCYAAELLPEVDKLLYLDLDIQIDHDISELWDIDIDNYAIAGVIDLNVRSYPFSYMPNINSYINSGVLLMNLKYFREHGITEMLHAELNSQKLRFPDQDALNIVCYGKIKYLSHKWNSGALCGYHDNPKILHCSSVKPWDPYSKYYPSWIYDYLLSGAKQSVYAL